MPRLGGCISPDNRTGKRNHTANVRRQPFSRLLIHFLKANLFGNPSFRRRPLREFSAYQRKEGGQPMSDTMLVVGATGMQGGGVARHLLERDAIKIRCMTRRPDSEPAKLLQQRGADVVQADLDDPASIRRAMHGCHGVFGVTNFWEAFFREYDQGVNLIDAAAEAGVGHLVLSTLPSSRKISRGAIDFPHFQTKAPLKKHVHPPNVPFTFVHVAFYYENFVIYFPPQRQPDCSYSFGFPLPEAQLRPLPTEDIRAVVTNILANPPHPL